MRQRDPHGGAERPARYPDLEADLGQHRPGDPLRTRTYSTTLTFMLSTTNP